MNKRRASIDPAQLGFTFDPPVAPQRAADLAGFDRVVAAAVAQALKNDPRDRYEIAAAMSRLLDEDVTKFMLDAYASEARDQHNIPAHRALALVLVTERYDLLDAMVRRIGASLLVGEEIITARLGHLQAQRSAIDTELKQLRGKVQPIHRGEKRA